MITITVDYNNNQIRIDATEPKRNKIITFPGDGQFGKIIDVITEVINAVEDEPAYGPGIMLESINEDKRTTIEEW